MENKIKYYYKDNEGNDKRYRGKIIERDGKLFGEIITNNIVEKRTELIQESEGIKEIKGETYLAWKDIYDIEHRLTDLDTVIDNKVKKEYNDIIEIDYKPKIDAKIWFTYNDKQYEGEIIEENGKFYGIIEKEIQ